MGIGMEIGRGQSGRDVFRAAEMCVLFMVNRRARFAKEMMGRMKIAVGYI